MGSDRLPGPQPTFLFGADRHLRVEMAIAQIPEGGRFAAASLPLRLEMAIAQIPESVRFAAASPSLRLVVQLSEIASR